MTMKKRWVQIAEGDNEAVVLLAKQLNIDDSLAKVLVQRGITTFNQAKAFFRPQISQLHDPF
jgi:single-stranded-DNA-specific exonuclease